MDEKVKDLEEMLRKAFRQRWLYRLEWLICLIGMYASSRDAILHANIWAVIAWVMFIIDMWRCLERARKLDVVVSVIERNKEELKAQNAEAEH